AVADVVHNFTPVVNVATTADAFVRAAAADARHPDSAFVAQGISMARAASWESIVASMSALLLSSLSGQVEIPKMRSERVSERLADQSVERAGERIVERTPGMGVAAASRASA
ncbi:MAG: hypothetical protein ACR2GG_06695, partial [Gemmatimonadaceae bacterium]